MNILLLGPSPEKLLPCMENNNDKFFSHNDKIDRSFVLDRSINLLISYNYRYIIEEEVLRLLHFRTYNLHTSLLPFNRGAHPVLWSILEKTPLGVTVHKISQGLDTGPVVFQKEIEIEDDSKSLRDAYEFANQELVLLFCENWQTIRNNKYKQSPQIGTGTYHRNSEAQAFLSSLNISWDTSIQNTRIAYAKYTK